MKTYLFHSAAHQMHFDALVSRDGTADGDLERKALFFILSGQEDLNMFVNRIYNFEDRIIKLDCFNSGWMTSGFHALISLGFNLYSGGGYDANVYDTFCHLDKENQRLALDAIRLRFQLN
jgi:hypothetical protein